MGVFWALGFPTRPLVCANSFFKGFEFWVPILKVVDNGAIMALYRDSELEARTRGQ